MDRLVLRKARNRDVAKFSRYYLPNVEFIGFAGDVGGECVGVGIACWGLDDRVWLMLEANSVVYSRFKFTLHRAAVALVTSILSVRSEVFCLESVKVPKAGAWLTRLGFSPTGEIKGGENVWVRTNHPRGIGIGRLGSGNGRAVDRDGGGGRGHTVHGAAG